MTRLSALLRHPFMGWCAPDPHPQHSHTTAVTSMWSAARDDLETGDLAYGPNDGTRGLAGPHERDDAWLTFGRPPGEIGDVDSFPHTNTGGTR